MSDHATATVSDELFAIPGATDPEGTCAITGLINTALALPIAQGDTTPSKAREIKNELTIFPPGAEVPTTTTTTTIPAPTTTTPLATDKTTVEAGGQITVHGDGWKPATTVTIILLSDPVTLGTASVNAQGAFSTVVTIPAGTPPGPHTLRVTGTAADGTPRTVEQAITVTAAQLPRTGTDPMPLALISIALLASGVALLAPHRRRLRRG